MNAATRTVLVIFCAAMLGCGGGGSSSTTASQEQGAPVSGLAVPGHISLVTANNP